MSTAVFAPIDPGAPPYSASIALAGGVAQVYVFDRRGANGPCKLFIAETAGAHPIDTTAIALAVNTNAAGSYQTQTAAGTAIGSIAAGGNATWDIWDDAARFIKVTLTSTLGATAFVEMRSL